MASVKVSISIEKTLLSRLDELARELQISRSRLVSLALESYLAQRDAQKLANKLDEAQTGEPVGENRE